MVTKRKRQTSTSKKEPNTKRYTKKYTKKAKTSGSSIAIFRAPRTPPPKAIDNFGTAVACTLTGTVNLVHVIQEGTDTQQRIGRDVTMQSLYVRYGLTIGNAFTNGACATIRWAMVYDKQTNGALPTFASIFGTYSGTSTTGYLPFVPVNLDNSDRYIILCDKTFVVDQDTANQCYMQWYKKVSLPIGYTGTAGVIANVLSGGIYFVECYTTDAALTTAPFYNLHVRGRYVDR